jgi:hypothetical protein
VAKISVISWKRAAGLSFLVAYGPFIVMAIYTLLFVSCSHCQMTTWMLLPCAPGLIPLETGSLWLHLPKPTNVLPIVAPAAIVSLAMVLLLAWLAWRGRWLRLAALGVSLAAFSYFAIILLAKIRA